MVSFAAACALCAIVVMTFALVFPAPSTLALWSVTVLLTYLVSAYQRRTGPGYNIPAACSVGDVRVETRLPTSFAGDGDCPVRLGPAPDDATRLLVYRRYPTAEPWTSVPFEAAEGGLVAHIPRQPAAGKVEYHIELTRGGERCTLPRRDNVIVRFRGSVSAAVLLPHVLLMLAAMVLSVRAGLEAWYGGAGQSIYATLTLLALVGGGIIFGPLVQKAAFGKYWTGVPFGHDLTDNKTLIAVVAWAVALVAGWVGREHADVWRLAASGISLLAFLIPHSLFGSELRYDDEHPQRSKREDASVAGG